MLLAHAFVQTDWHFVRYWLITDHIKSIWSYKTQNKKCFEILQVSFGITTLYSMYNMKREIDFDIFLKITVNCLNNFIWELN